MDPKELRELKDLLQEQGEVFDKYKETNDIALAAMKAGQAEPPETTEKLAKIEKSLQKLEGDILDAAKKGNRPPVGDKGEQAKSEYAQNFSDFVRVGEEESTGLMARLKETNPRKATMKTTSSKDGGLLVPEEVERDLLELAQDETPMRGVCRVITVGSPDYHRRVSLGGTSFQWLGETDAPDKTDTPTFADISPYWGKKSAMPEVTEDSLDDMWLDVEAFLKEKIVAEFSDGENKAFTYGDGEKKPRGILGYPTSADADSSRAFGTLQFVKTGVADGFLPVAPTGTPETMPADILVNLEMALKGVYRKNARWMMATSILATVRKWKDTTGQYIWQPGLQLGEPARLNGYPFVVNEDMPSVAAGTIPLAFGDFKRGYCITDLAGSIRMQRDPYSNKPYVQFFTRGRVGGMLEDSQAIKLAKISA